MEYTLDDIDQYHNDLQFAQWLSAEGFIQTEGANCHLCGAPMELRSKEKKLLDTMLLTVCLLMPASTSKQ